MDNSSPLVNSEAYAAERKNEDFAMLRQAAMERTDASSRHPTVALPGSVFKHGHVDCSLISASHCKSAAQECAWNGNFDTRHFVCSDTFCFATANLKGEKASDTTDVDVRPANKLGRDTRKKIVDEALATKDQDQYRFLKLIKDRMDA